VYKGSSETAATSRFGQFQNSHDVYKGLSETDRTRYDYLRSLCYHQIAGPLPAGVQDSRHAGVSTVFAERVTRGSLEIAQFCQPKASLIISLSPGSSHTSISRPDPAHDTILTPNGKHAPKRYSKERYRCGSDTQNWPFRYPRCRRIGIIAVPPTGYR